MDYIQKLKKTALDAQDQIGGLQDDLYQKENWIRDLQSKIEKQKQAVNHRNIELDKITDIDYNNKLNGL